MIYQLFNVILNVFKDVLKGDSVYCLSSLPSTNAPNCFAGLTLGFLPYGTLVIKERQHCGSKQTCTRDKERAFEFTAMAANIHIISCILTACHHTCHYPNHGCVNAHYDRSV